jgi:acetylglutamate kinase
MAPLARLCRSHGSRQCGGAAIGRPELRAPFAADVVSLQRAGVRPVIVHGGGPQIDALMRRVGKSPRFVDGLRVTDTETMELVEMVLVGKINSDIVALLNQHGGRAIGLTGKDADLIVAHREVHRLAGGETVDLGLVGEIERVDAEPLQLLEDHELIPVVAPVAAGRDGETYNVNADYVAAALAAALHAVMLLQVTDVPGIRDAEGRLLRRLDRAGVERLVQAGIIDGGMRPKTDAAVRALADGVDRVQIIDGRHPHAVALAVMGRLPTGTEITP